MQHPTSTSTHSSSEDTSKTIGRASLLLMASYFMSRVIGFFREWTIATTVGASATTDVYYASFTVPDLLNYLMATGALSISFIPILSRFLTENRQPVGERVFRLVASWMGLLLLVMVLVFELFSNQFAVLIAPGFTLEQTALLSTLLRIIVPGQVFFFWGGLAISVQYAHGRFFLPALAPIIYNLSIILFGVLLHRQLGVMGFSIGVLVGAIISHGLVPWWGIRNLGYSCRPLFRAGSAEIWSAVKQYFWLSLPIMLGFSLVVTDEWIAKFFASSMESRAVSWLSFARTEMRIPVAIIGQVAGVASFPFLARLWASGQRDAYGHTLLREIEKLWVLAPLSTIILVDHALPLTHFIFGGGAFTAEDLIATSNALQMFGVGVLFWILQVVFARGFYACQMNWLPSVLGSAITVISIPLYGYLGDRFGYRGLALSGSIGIGVYSILLWCVLAVHLKKNCTGLSFSSFYKFCAAWGGVLAIEVLVSHWIHRFGLYQQTRWTGLLDVVVATAIVTLFGWLCLRTVLKRFTNGKPIF